MLNSATRNQKISATVLAAATVAAVTLGSAAAANAAAPVHTTNQAAGNVATHQSAAKPQTVKWSVKDSISRLGHITSITGATIFTYKSPTELTTNTKIKFTIQGVPGTYELSKLDLHKIGDKWWGPMEVKMDGIPVYDNNDGTLTISDNGAHFQLVGPAILTFEGTSAAA